MSKQTSRLHQHFVQAKAPAVAEAVPAAAQEDLDADVKATGPHAPVIIEPDTTNAQAAVTAFNELEASADDENSQDFESTLEGLKDTTDFIQAANAAGGMSAESAYFAGLTLEAYAGRLGMEFESVNQSLESVIGESDGKHSIAVEELVAALEGVDDYKKQLGKRWVSVWQRLLSFTATRIKLAAGGLAVIAKQAQSLKGKAVAGGQITVKKSYVMEGDSVPADVGAAFVKAGEILKYLSGPFAKQATEDFRYNSTQMVHVLDDVLDGKFAKIRTKEVDDAFVNHLPQLWSKWRDPRKKIGQDPSKPIIGNYVFFEDHSLKYHGDNEAAKHFDEFANHGYPTLISYQHKKAEGDGGSVEIKALSPEQISTVCGQLIEAAKNASLFRGFVEAVANSPVGFTVGAGVKYAKRDDGDFAAVLAGFLKVPELITVRDASNTSNRLTIHTCYDAGRALIATIHHFKKIAKLSLKAHGKAATESWDQATADDGVSVNETSPIEPRQEPGKGDQAPEGEVIPHKETFQDGAEAHQNLDGPVQGATESASPVETFDKPAEAKDAAADQEGKQPAAVQGGTPDTEQAEHDAALRAKAADGVQEGAAAVADDKADGQVAAAVAGGTPDTTQVVEKADLTASAATGVHEEAAAKADEHADGKVVAAVQSVSGATVQTVSTDAALRGKAIESVKDPVPYWFTR